MSHFFHEGERAVQTRAGVAAMAARVAGGIRAELPPRAQSFLLDQRFAVLASRDTQGRMWASIVYGPAGFLSSPSERGIEIDAAPIAGDPLGANLVPGAPLGVLVIELATRRRMRVNGRVARAAAPIRVSVDEVFANCPKYIQRRDLALENVPDSRHLPVSASDALDNAQCQRMRQADTCFLASGHGEAGLDASHRGGAPGFIQVLDERHIAWPDYAGNSMFQTLGNLASDPACGLTMADFANGDVLQISGRARIDWNPSRAARFTGAERFVELEIDVVRDTRGALPLRAHTVEPSPFNP